GERAAAAVQRRRLRPGRCRARPRRRHPRGRGDRPERRSAAAGPVAGAPRRADRAWSAAVAGEGHADPAGEPGPDRGLLHHRDLRKGRLLPVELRGVPARAARPGGDRRRHLPRRRRRRRRGRRGPLRARDRPADGRGRRNSADPVPHRRPGRRAATGGGAAVRRGLARPPARRRRVLPVARRAPGTPGPGPADRRRGAAALCAVGAVLRGVRRLMSPVPEAAIRTQVRVPLRFPDGYATTAAVTTFHGLVDGREHLALGLGPTTAVPLVRPHSECLTGDVFGSQRCDCGPQLREAVQRITATGGYLLYLRQEGRGIGLYAKLDAYALQDTGLDTYEANVALGHGEDERSYLVAAQMLQALGVSRIALLSNNPDKARQLRRFGVTVAELVPTGVHLSAANARYLGTKARRGAHTLDLPL